MSFDRVAVYTALATRVSTALGFTVQTGRCLHWAQVNSFPYAHLGQALHERSDHFPRWTLVGELTVYLQNTSADGPAEDLARAADAVDHALQWQPGDGTGPGRPTDLGGLVVSARLVSVETDGGHLGDVGVSAMMIEVIVQS